jgi:transcriptional regulator with XRE-family HTH domain
MSPNVQIEPVGMTPAQTARIVKEARLKKQLTQKELAEYAGISVRSLQRIENGEVLPRAYTWRQLGIHIDLQLEFPEQVPLPASSSRPTKLNLPRKWILSIAVPVVIILSFSAFVAQSPTFPETLFEAINMILAGCVLYAVILFRIWK